jgi:hypothetical protein
MKNISKEKSKFHIILFSATKVEHLSFKLINPKKRLEIVLALLEKYSNNFNQSQLGFC